MSVVCKYINYFLYEAEIVYKYLLKCANIYIYAIVNIGITHYDHHLIHVDPRVLLP